MIERSIAWYPLSDIDCPFGSISYSYHRGKKLSVTLHGERTLNLSFTTVTAVRFELECPGYDPIPKPLPGLKQNPRYSFPLLIIENSQWSEQFTPIYGELLQFVLISSDDLVQIIASPIVLAEWV